MTKNKKVKSKIFHYNFFPKSHKAAIEELIKIILWIALFIILVAGVYFLTKFLTT